MADLKNPLWGGGGVVYVAEGHQRPLIEHWGGFL